MAGDSIADAPAKPGEKPTTSAPPSPLSDKDSLNIITAQRTAAVDKLIDQNHLPSSWHYEQGEDPAGWQTIASGLAKMTLQTMGDIDAMDRLHRMNENFPFELPKGATVTRDKDNRITNIGLDLPTDLTHLNESDVAKLHELRTWLTKYAPQVENVTKQIKQATDSPRSALSWGDEPVAHQTKPDGSKTVPVGLFDSHDQFMGDIDKSELGADGLPQGFSTKPLNLVESRFKLKTEKNGDITVSQTVRAQEVPWYGYQNLIYDDVGKPMQAVRTYKPDDFVVVRDSGELKLLQAKDLSTMKLENESMHYGAKALVGALDVGMLATGTVELGAAYRAVRIGAAATTAFSVATVAETAKVGTLIANDEALQLSNSNLTGVSSAESMQPVIGNAAKYRILAGGALRTTVGATGLFNNAGADDTTYGKNINEIRGYYFLADTGLGLASKGVSGTLSRFDLDLLPRSTEAAKQALLAQQRTLSLMHTASTFTFKAAEPLIALQVGTTLEQQIQQELFPDTKPQVSTALAAYQAGQSK